MELVIFVLEMLKDVRFGVPSVSFALCTYAEHTSASHSFLVRPWFSNLKRK